MGGHEGVGGGGDRGLDGVWGGKFALPAPEENRFAGLSLLGLRLRRPRPRQARSVSQPKQLSPPILLRRGEGAVDRYTLAPAAVSLFRPDSGL